MGLCFSYRRNQFDAFDASRLMPPSVMPATALQCRLAAEPPTLHANVVLSSAPMLQLAKCLFG